MTAAVAKGAFGKIPSHGDFIRLDLPGAFIRCWDDWLQNGMIAVRELAGARWDECYLSAPIWRFSLPPGMAGSHAASGVLMASVDRVGRQYPLTLAVTGLAGRTALRHFANASLFERLETIALDALDHDLDRDDLSREMSQISPAPVPGGPLLADGYHGSLAPEHVLAARQIEQTQGEVALWTTCVGLDHRLLLTRGLPDLRHFAGLFDLGASIWRTAVSEAQVE